MPPPPDTQDPLDALKGIIGPNSVDTRVDVHRRRPKRLLKDVKFEDASLEDFAKPDPPSGDVVRSEANAASTYHKEQHKYEDFQTSIADCDEVLKSVEIYLTNFQAELGQVSAEIENLQTRSIEMNAKLENRKKVETLLGPAVEEISISPQTVRAIAEAPVDESWLQALKELETRSVAIESKLKSDEPIKALDDVKPMLDDLKAKAIERIRDFTVGQIKALRSPNINAQILQQQTFLRYKQLYAYLAGNHPTLGDEIGQAYINTIRWYYLHNFTRYHAALQGLQIHNVDQLDLLGSDSTTSRRANVSANGKTSFAPHDAFNLGRRGDVLKSAGSAITSYLASETKAPQYMEVPFQNYNSALIDNVCHEYSIDSEIFSTKSFQQVSRKATEIFEPVFALGQSLTKSLIEQSTDCLGVLICVRLNQHFAFELQRRKVPVAESYINGTNMLLWPRFQQIMDLHCESLKKTATSSSAARNATNTALSLVGSGSTSDLSKSSSVAPHLITQRFGQFLHGILALSSEAGDDEPVFNSLIRLRNEFDSLMLKLSKSVGGDQRKRLRFLENQYSLILTILGDVQGKLAEEMKASLVERLNEARNRG